MAKKIKLTNKDDDFQGSGKDEIIIAKAGDDSVSGGGGNDKINGGDGNDTLKGGSGDDTLNGGEGNDILLGGAGDDTLNGGTGDNTVNGGDGDDTIVLAGNFADAEVTKDGAGYKIVTAAGTTFVSNVELFRFADGTVIEEDILGKDVGTTFTLTTTIDNVTGTTGDDLIIGANDGTAASTFNTADTISGGEGMDTLRVVLAGGNDVLPVLSGVETVEITDISGSDLEMVSSTGVKTIAVVNSTEWTDVNDLDAVTDISVTGTKNNGGVETTYQATAVAGAADAVKVSLNNNGSKFEQSGGVYIGAGVEELTATITGNNNIADLGGDSLTKMTLTGAGNLEAWGDFGSSVLKTLDASAMTGSVVGYLGQAVGIAQTITTGSGDDYLEFDSELTSKDVVDLGAGNDGVGVTSANISAASNATLGGLNALKNVEGVLFYDSNDLTLDHSTLTNAAIIDFNISTDGGADDTILNAAAAFTYTSGRRNDGDLTFVMKGGETKLNLTLDGQNIAEDNNNDGTQIGTLDTGLALNIALTSQDATEASTWNDIDLINNAVNSTFTVTGDGNLDVGGVNNAIIFDASALTGKLVLWASGANDIIKGGSNTNVIQGDAGVDLIDISASASKVDTIDLVDELTSAERDSITGFTTGAGGDKIQLDADALDGNGTTSPNIQELAANVGTVNILSNSDVLEFAFSVAGSGLGDGSVGSLNGANLLAAVGTINTADQNEDGYLIAYQGGNAYLYHYDNAGDNDNVLTAVDIELVATLNGVTAGSVAASNFELV